MDLTVNQFLKNRDNNFDFIRFLAALAVIFSHSFDVTPGVKEPLVSFSHGIFSFGSISVAIFFIISGMLISMSFDRSASFLNFARSRVLRIYPALIVTILVTVFVIGPFFTKVSMSEYFHNLNTFRYLRNILAVHIYYPLPGLFIGNPLHGIVNASLWSLPQEIGCYFLVAAFGFLLTKRYFQFIIVALIAILLYRSVLFYEHAQNVFYFGLGSLIYIFRTRITINKFFAFFAFVALIMNLYFNTNQLSAYIITGFSLGYFLLFIGFVKTTSIKNFSKHGDFSYGLYIYAFPIQQILFLELPELNVYSHFLIAASITMVFAYLSWHFIESPAMKLKRHLVIGKFSYLSQVKAKRSKFNFFTQKLNSSLKN